MSALPRHAIAGRWLPSIIHVGLILTLGIGLFGLTRLHDSQTASTLTLHLGGN
jgi:hypothetical protein